MPRAVAERRRRELMQVQRAISKRKLRAMVGRELDVLVEGGSEESEYLAEGRQAGQAPEIDGKAILALGDGEAVPRAAPELFPGRPPPRHWWGYRERESTPSRYSGHGS